MNVSSKKNNVVYALFGLESDMVYFKDIYSVVDGRAAPYICVREAVEKAGYEFKLTANYFDLKNVKYLFATPNDPQMLAGISHCKVPKERCAMIDQEPPIESKPYDPNIGNYFGKIFTLADRLVDNKLFFKYYHPMPKNKVIGNIPNFEDKKFCVMVQGNHNHSLFGLSEIRRQSAKYFSSKEGFDLFGTNWHGYSSWRGMLGSNWHGVGRSAEIPARKTVRT